MVDWNTEKGFDISRVETLRFWRTWSYMGRRFLYRKRCRSDQIVWSKFRCWLLPKWLKGVKRRSAKSCAIECHPSSSLDPFFVLLDDDGIQTLFLGFGSTPRKQIHVSKSRRVDESTHSVWLVSCDSRHQVLNCRRSPCLWMWRPSFRTQRFRDHVFFFQHRGPSKLSAIRQLSSFLRSTHTHVMGWRIYSCQTAGSINHQESRSRPIVKLPSCFNSDLFMRGLGGTYGPMS